jgi:hypothetical protein
MTGQEEKNIGSELTGAGGNGARGKARPETVADVLNAAADLLEKPGAWTQDAYARSAKGNKVLPAGDKAVCWCASGALARVQGLGGYEAEYSDAGHVLARTVSIIDIPIWNDTPERTQAEVVAALRAAALASGAATKPRTPDAQDHPGMTPK